MTTKSVSTHEAKTHLSRYLSEVEAGAEVVIKRGNKPVAVLVPYAAQRRQERPRVGALATAAFAVPEEAFAPLTAEELKAWGL